MRHCVKLLICLHFLINSASVPHFSSKDLLVIFQKKGQEFFALLSENWGEYMEIEAL